MKRTLTRSIFIMILALAFIGGIVFFITEIALNSSDWVQQEFNGHMSGSGGLEQAGKILDRNGVVLAETVDGNRVYNSDKTTRMAVLHTVGDNSLNISTAIQSTYRTDLTGYNYIWGLGLPQTLKSSRDVKITLDSSICKTAYQALGDRHGAIVVYNYKTGEIMCMVSATTYDPEDPPKITEENENEYKGAYLNRVLSANFTPGSIFKVITATCAIENIPDIYTRTFNCNGGVVMNGEEITCMEHHGEISFKDGLAKSCNVVFSELAVELGADKMTKTAAELGFGKSFEISGIPTVKSDYNVQNTTDNELGWSGIGQYTDLANPMHMAILMGAIANGGTPVMPFTVLSESGYFGIDGITNSGNLGEQLMSSDVAKQLDELLRYDVTSYYGDSMFPSLSVCAKTGTAETSDTGNQPDAWMIGYSQDSDAPLAFAVVIEEGGYGYSEAGPVAVAAMEACASALRNGNNQ